MKESWRPVVGLESKYAVSNLGRIRRLTNATSTEAGRIVTPSIDSDGYSVVTFTITPGRRKALKVHRLVLQAFLPNPQMLLQSNHLDGDKQHNAVRNLEWADASRNICHAFSTGLNSQSGEANNRAKLTNAKVAVIRAAHANGVGVCRLARRFHVTHSAISMIIKGKRWQ